jgi:L-threonylcarbamoyladenylate synthase
MKTDIISASHSSALLHALDVLQHGGLVAFPTDTVYGLAAPLFREDSIERLYVVKGRNHAKAIAVLMGDLRDLEKVAQNINAEALRLAKMFWPGPLTLVVTRHPSLPEILAPLPTIGVRIPNHPFALQLLQTSGPLAVTSANLSGEANATTAQEVYRALKGRIHLILDGGPTPGGVPSTVIDCTTPAIQILRAGPISENAIQAVLLHP